MAPLRFAAFSSDVELPFYTALASLKINHDKLDDSARRVLGLYEIRPNEEPANSCRLQVRGNALTSDDVPSASYRAEGIIKNLNTIEEYRTLDKAAFLTQAGRTVWDAIQDGSIYSCPALLASFCVICFADLKKYKFTYLFGFPTIHSDVNWQTYDPAPAEAGTPETSLEPLHLPTDHVASLVDSVQTWRYAVDARQHGFFLAKKVKGRNLDFQSANVLDDARPATPASPPVPDIGFQWVISTIESFEKGFFDDIPSEDQYICFADPSTYSSYPGWVLRNFLVLMRHRWHLERAQILCYRDIQPRRHEARSLVLPLRIEQAVENRDSASAPTSLTQDLPPLKITGWERNHARKFASKIANLGEYMNPGRLADQAVDLNLKLIKWRIAPGLDLSTVKSSSCLLLGAGTLGTYVARNLLGWGIRKITFVDNGSVSFSNPVRQPLFNFQDCLAGGAKKATRAAAALKEIFPGAESTGFDLSVPMAGHPILDTKKTKSDFEVLQRLVEEHDIIFLLMDTRESRWLPTLMGRAAGKLVMNAALGFDTFVVMRHGCRNDSQPGEELGCYFCNDVVAPADSLADRTLDQQCTVTRPGVAAIASALLVEIAISVLQHKDKGLAPAPMPGTSEAQDHPLGIVPHQIRGFLSSFRNVVTCGKRYSCCSACSDNIVNAYSAGKWEFVERALNERGYVEEVSGLAQVRTGLCILLEPTNGVKIQRDAEKAAAEVDWDASSESASSGSEAEIV